MNKGLEHWSFKKFELIAWKKCLGEVRGKLMLEKLLGELREKT